MSSTPVRQRGAVRASATKAKTSSTGRRIPTVRSAVGMRGYLSPMHLDPDVALERAAAADHGVLATLGQARAADLVPACFAIVGAWLAVPIDSVKPKGSTALGRVRNLERDPRATLLVEHWDPAEWSRLWWVRLLLVRADPPADVTARLEAGLRARYPQYATARFVDVLEFRIDHL